MTAPAPSDPSDTNAIQERDAKPRTHLKDGLLRQEGTGRTMAVDRFDAKALKDLHVQLENGADQAGPPPLPPEVRQPRDTHEMEPIPEDEPFRPMGPETLLGLLSKAHLEYFQEDFQQVQAEFVKLRYHIGQWNEPYELHSEAFPLEVDSWNAMRDRLSEHIRTSLDNVPMDDLSQIPVRMVYFHDSSLCLKEGAAQGGLSHPLDFACWLRLTVGELADLIVEGAPPAQVRIGFDASYHWLGPETHRPFAYVKHWRFFAEVLIALSRLLGRPLRPMDPVLRMVLSHTSADLADMVLGLGQMDKRIYEDTARVYRPRIETVFGSDRVSAVFEDPQGIMRLYATDITLGAWKRGITGNRVLLEREHPERRHPV